MDGGESKLEPNLEVPSEQKKKCKKFSEIRKVKSLEEEVLESCDKIKMETQITSTSDMKGRTVVYYSSYANFWFKHTKYLYLTMHHTEKAS